MYTSGDLIQGLIGLIIFIMIVAYCCSADSGTSKSNTTRKTVNRNQGNHSSSSYDFCPSCGASHYDGYCEECGYPDINQGWLGENF